MLMTKDCGQHWPTMDEVEPDRTGSIPGLSFTGFHRIAYADWGPEEASVPVVCVHGLTRQGRDFDPLAMRLAAGGRRVVCPDVVGRGRSGRLRDPNHYALPQYCADMNALISSLGADQVDWVGTSLGGLIGMVLAGMPCSPIRRIVINDIGPYLPSSGLLRIGSYVAAMPRAFASIEDAEAYFRATLAPYGALSDEHWRHLTRHSVQWDAARRHYAMLCDSRIIWALRNPWHYSTDLWSYWRAIEAPILVLRGTESDFLPVDLLRAMSRENGSAMFHDCPGCGHVPPLVTSEQIAPVAEFLCN